MSTDEKIAIAWDKRFKGQAEELAKKLDQLLELVADNKKAVEIVYEIVEWAGNHVGRVPLKKELEHLRAENAELREWLNLEMEMK